jgi:hypothetical protein
MKPRFPSPFGYDTANGCQILRFESHDAKDGIEITAFGADDEMANTMFAVWVGDDRVLTRRPEPLLVEFVGNIVEDGMFILEVGDIIKKKIRLDEKRREHLAEVQSELKDGLENAPLGP